jgi:AraC family transcriptional regulator
MVVISDEPGLVESPASVNTIVAIHMGPPADITCSRRDERYRGTAIHGDIDIIPSGTPSRWELKDKDTALLLSLSPKLLRAVAEDLDIDPDRVEIRNRFQMRDAQIEHIAWAAKAEMDRGYPCGRLYLDSLGTALAAQLVRTYSTLPRLAGHFRAGLSGPKLKQVLGFIEENLGDTLSLDSIAGAAGLSVSHCKALFRQTMGVPLHQYVIRRRVERAVVLLREDKLSICQIALETGFSHQSHLALHMRRVLGMSPKALRRNFH